MKVLFVPGQKTNYVRNQILVKALRISGIEVLNCGSNIGTYPLRICKSILSFLESRSNDVDLLLIGFYGQPLVPFFKKITNMPILFDAFLSTYDTLCLERRTFNCESPICSLAKVIDKKSCSLADSVILDTNEHIAFFRRTFNLDDIRFNRLFVGADDDLFYPREYIEHEMFTVFFHGTFRPLQGVDVIIKAARSLKDENVMFRIVGGGPEKSKIMKEAHKWNTKNIEFIDWIDYESLPMAIANSDICLGGHFSTIDKASRVIAGKTFQYIAMRKPVIVGRNKANSELLSEEDDVMMVEMGNPNSLAEAILELRSDEGLRDKLATNSYKKFLSTCTPRLIGEQLKELCKETIGD